MNYGLNVKQNVLAVTLGLVVTIALTFMAVQFLDIFLVLVMLSIVLGIFSLIKDSWRRAYALLVIAMTAGTSHIVLLAQVGSLAKLLALGLLLIVTAFTTKKIERVLLGKLHQRTIGVLWAIVALAGISIVWSESRIETVIQTAILAGFVYLFHRVSTTRWLDRSILIGDTVCAYWTMVALLAVGILLALLGFPEAISSFSGRWQGLYNNPNLLGMLAALTTSLGLGLALHKRSWLVLISILVPLSQVVLSESRTAIIATAVSIVWVFLKSRAQYTVVLILALTLIWLGGRTLGVSLISAQSFQRFGAQEGGDLLNSRTEGWTDALNGLVEHPLGVGWAASTDVLAAYREMGIGAGLSSVHNSYLQLVYELGWAGVIPAVLILLLMARVATLPVKTGLDAGLASAVVSGAIIQFAESAIFGVGQPFPYFFWFAVFACIVTHQPRELEVRANPSSLNLDRCRAERAKY